MSTVLSTYPREHYADLIRDDLQKSVEGIIAAGRHLIEAQDKLEHGDWLKMIENDLPFGKRTAQMLMKIARHPVLSNANHGSLLPTSWRTLYELAQLPPKKLEAKLIDGTITADIERKDIAKLKARGTRRASAPAQPKPRPLTAFEELHLEVMRLRERLVTEARENPDAVKALAAALAAIVQDAQDLALFAALAEKTTRGDGDRPPTADLKPVAVPDPDSVKPIEDAPPVAPATPDDGFPEMPAWMRRIKPKNTASTKPSLVPEGAADALQELIDAGVDPDDAMERLQEQADRWS